MEPDSIELLLKENSWTAQGSRRSQPAWTRRLFNGDQTTQLTHDAYSEYCRRQWHLIAGHGDGRYVATQAPRDMSDLLRLIRDGIPREDILKDLMMSTKADEEACRSSVNLAARLLTMMKFGVVKHQAIARRFLEWNTV